MTAKRRVNRRGFLQTAAVAGAGFAMPALWTSRALAAGPPTPIDPIAPGYRAAVQFKNPVNVPPALDGTSGKAKLAISVQANQQFLGLVDPKNLKKPLLTNIFGYNGIYPGPTILGFKNKPVSVTWINNLPATHLLDPLDHTTIMSAYEPGKGVPIATHVHGGHTDAAFDGTPDQWWKPSGAHGPTYPGTDTFVYDNSQESGTVWYHDHALGVTRLNVYAGMAGYFLILDDNDNFLVKMNWLPARQYEFGLAIQDRMFDTNGQFFYPGCGIDSPTTMYPEMFGNFMLVNGVVWPFANVEPRPYRFRLLNGCDSRWLHLFLSDNSVPFHQVGSELGLLDTPVDVNKMVLPQPVGADPQMQPTGLLLAPGERADVVIDFSRFAGKTLVLRNDANAPMPNGDPGNWDADTVGQVMQFRVNQPLNKAIPRSTLPQFLRPVSGPVLPLIPLLAARTRKLLLFETPDDGFGRIMPMLGTVDGAMPYHTGPITETPRLGDVEIWEIYNTTPDLHPMHVHLVGHQVLGRFPFSAIIDSTGKLSHIKVDQNGNLGLEANEHGWKDTTHMWPGVAPNPEPVPFPSAGVPIQGQMTRIIAKFDKPGLYVWHCHILSHEEHDMMRPFFVFDKQHPVPAWPPM